MTEDRLKQILVADLGEACNRADDIWAAAHGDLRGDALTELVAHVQGCGACASDWALAVEARRGEVEKASPRGMPKWTSWLAPLAVAAAALIAGLVWVWSPYDGADSAWRAHSPHDVVLLTDEGASVSDRMLRWEPVNDALHYDVVLLSEDGRPLHRIDDVPVSEVRLPSELGAQTLLWSVEAHMKDGGTRRSDVRRVVVP